MGNGTTKSRLFNVTPFILLHHFNIIIFILKKLFIYLITIIINNSKMFANNFLQCKSIITNGIPFLILYSILLSKFLTVYIEMDKNIYNNIYSSFAIEE